MALYKRSLKRLLSSTIEHIREYSASAERAIPPAKQRYVPTSGTYPQGFLAGSSYAGVKASNTKYDDIAMVVSETPCVADVVVTRNLFKAAPVVLSQGLVLKRRNVGFRGVIVNSGCANAVTGSTGEQNAREMGRLTDKCFTTEETSNDVLPQTLIMSTGVIGQRLPMQRIRPAIPKAYENLGSSHESWLNAAKAICTTDTFPKLISRTFTLPSHPETEYRIAGMTKGAGMIHPNMGTLLGIICTDANVDAAAIHYFLTGAANLSFNSISIDGDTSTNDTVALFANGAAAPGDSAPITGPPSGVRKERNSRLTPDAEAFLTVLTDFMKDLAKLVVRDGEGATKFITIRVQSEHSSFVAKRAAASIATSALFKTAMYGKDANWGRILCAIGYAPGIVTTPYANVQSDAYAVDPAKTCVSFIPADGSPELKLLVNGEPEEVDEKRANEVLSMEDVEVLVRLPQRQDLERPSDFRREKLYETVFWTCDFSHEYVTINGDYRT